MSIEDVNNKRDLMNTALANYKTTIQEGGDVASALETFKQAGRDFSVAVRNTYGTPGYEAKEFFLSQPLPAGKSVDDIVRIFDVGSAYYLAWDDTKPLYEYKNVAMDNLQHTIDITNVTYTRMAMVPTTLKISRTSRTYAEVEILPETEIFSGYTHLAINAVNGDFQFDSNLGSDESSYVSSLPQRNLVSGICTIISGGGVGTYVTDANSNISEKGDLLMHHVPWSVGDKFAMEFLPSLNKVRSYYNGQLHGEIDVDFDVLFDRLDAVGSPEMVVAIQGYRRLKLRILQPTEWSVK